MEKMALDQRRDLCGARRSQRSAKDYTNAEFRFVERLAEQRKGEKPLKRDKREPFSELGI
jgi:hypothetical protein